MPLYEYECEQCGVTFEVIQKFSDTSVNTCRKCGGPVRRLLSAPAIQFKGTGWYVTDYARKGAGGAEKEKADSATKESSASSTTPASSTPSSGSDTKTASASSTTSDASSSSTTSSSDKK